MKRTFLKFASRKFVPALVIAASFVAFTPATSKASEKTIEILSSENSTSVQFAGSTDNAFFFDVKVNNPKAAKFTLTITAEDGEVLYSKDYTDASFSKKVKLLKGGDNIKYTFTIKSTDSNIDNSFVVSTVTKTVDDVVVTKL